MVSKDAVRLVAVVVMLMAAVSVRADSLPPVSSGGPNGYWSFAPYQSGSDPSSSTMFGLSGVGQMTDLTFGSWSNPQSGTVSTDLAWQPDKLTLGANYGPIVVTWTSLSAGDYTVTATISPSLLGGSSSGQFAQIRHTIRRRPRSNHIIGFVLGVHELWRRRYDCVCGLKRQQHRSIFWFFGELRPRSGAE